MDLNRIRQNIAAVRARTHTRIILMVKANAYGHGLKEVANAAVDLVDAFGVATVDEGIELRECGIKKPILTLICAPRELESAVESGLTVCISDTSQIDELERLIGAKKIRACDVNAQISLDTGMHRLGFCFDRLDSALARLKSLGVEINGAYSHLRARSRRQIDEFNKMCRKVRQYYPNALRHLASSHSLGVKSLRYDAVRLGISAYEGAMRVESEVIASRRVKAGEYVSYGNFKVKEDTNTAVIFGGYADGAARENPSSVYIRSRECRVLGRLCMDMTVVDCGDFLPDIGEKAVLSDESIIKKISKQRRSIEYTILTCWRGRTERIYGDKGGSKASCQSGGCRDEQRG